MTVQATGEVLGVKKVGAHHQLTLVAPGVAEEFRPGTLVTLTVGGALSDRLLRRTFPIHRVRVAGGYGGTVDVVLTADEPGSGWLATAAAGTPVDVVGPVGRPFALPTEPVTCVLVGHEAAAAALFPLAERLRERGSAVHMLLAAETEARLFGVLDARRTTRGVTVATRDGSLGIHGGVPDLLPDLLTRTEASVVYASGPFEVLHAAAAAAEQHGAWSQTAVPTPAACGTGLCLSCVLPVVGEDGIARDVRACSEGPVFRGDRVAWSLLGERG